MRAILPSLLCVWFVLLAHAAAGQSAVAGVVTDATGAVLPGVTVEASSPALIEKGRKRRPLTRPASIESWIFGQEPTPSPSH